MSQREVAIRSLWERDDVPDYYKGPKGDIFWLLAELAAAREKYERLITQTVDLTEREEKLREALRRIAAMRVARGGPENEWWEIARAALSTAALEGEG